MPLSQEMKLDFANLEDEEKRKVLIQTNSDFSSMAKEEQDKVLSAYSKKTIQVPQATEEPESKPLGGNRLIDTAAGMVETPLAIATGMVGGLAGMVGNIGMTAIKGGEEGEKFGKYVSDMYSYKPKSESAKGAMDIVGAAMTPFSIPKLIGGEVGKAIDTGTGNKTKDWEVGLGNVGDVAMLGLAPKIPTIAHEIGKIPYKTGRVLFRKTLAPAGDVAETRALTSFGFNPPTNINAGIWQRFKDRFKTYDSTMHGFKNFTKDLDAIKRDANQLIAANEGKTIPLNTLTKAFDDLAEGYGSMDVKPVGNIRALETMKKQVTDVWMKKYPDGQIPIPKVQEFKISLYGKIRDSAWKEAEAAMTTEGRKGLSVRMKEEIETVIPELGNVNRKMAPYLEFEDALNKSIVRIKNEKFSITNTVFNNDFLLGKLAKVFKAVSPKHPLASPEAIRAYAYAKKNVDFDEAFAPNKINPKQIEYKPQINLGMADVSGQPSSYTPPLLKPTMRALGYDRATTPIQMGMLDDSAVKVIKGAYNDPSFWSKNSDLTSTLLKIKDKKPMIMDEWNTLLERVMMNRMGSDINARIPLKSQYKVPPGSMHPGIGNRKGKLQMEDTTLADILKNLGNP